jgi:hypothetical protein
MDNGQLMAFNLSDLEVARFSRDYNSVFNLFHFPDQRDTNQHRQSHQMHELPKRLFGSSYQQRRSDAAPNHRKQHGD